MTFHKDRLFIVFSKTCFVAEINFCLLITTAVRGVVYEMLGNGLFLLIAITRCKIINNMFASYYIIDTLN